MQDELFHDRSPDCGRARSARVFPRETDQAPENLRPMASQVLEFALMEQVVEKQCSVRFSYFLQLQLILPFMVVRDISRVHHGMYKVTKNGENIAKGLHRDTREKMEIFLFFR